MQSTLLQSQPDVLQLGPSVRLEKVSNLASELNVTEEAARDLLKQLQVPIREVAGVSRYMPSSLELAMFAWFLPDHWDDFLLVLNKAEQYETLQNLMASTESVYTRRDKADLQRHLQRIYDVLIDRKGPPGRVGRPSKQTRETWRMKGWVD